MNSFRAASALIIALLVLAASAAHASECRVIVLREGDDGPVLETVSLIEGTPRTFEPGEIITVVLPFGVGMSGDLVKAEENSGAIRVACEGGAVRTTIAAPGGGERDLPTVALVDAETFDMRVNVTAGGGDKWVFLVRGYSSIEPAAGPVLDMFGGALPMSAGDYSITTEVTRHEELPGLSGEVPLTLQDGLLAAEVGGPDGETGLFVIDFGAGGTVVTRDFLPDGASVEPVLAIEHSTEGEKVLPGGMTGAGGDVGGFAGAARLESLTLGELELNDVSVSVIEEMPEFGTVPIDGIVGIDILGRADVATLEFGPEGAVLLTLEDASGVSGSGGDEGATELPFTIAADHIFIEGGLGDVPVTFLFDTGARSTIVPLSIAEAAALPPGSLPGREFRGLDGNLLPATAVRADELTLAGHEFPPLEMYAAELPVLESFGLDEDSGLLGMDFVLEFARMKIDFEEGVVRLWRVAP